MPSERRKCVNITQTGTCFEILNLFFSYQFAKFKDQINIGPGYQVISVNVMCRSNVIIYQNAIKFEI